MERAIFWLVALAVIVVVLESSRRIKRYVRRIKEHPKALATALEVLRDVSRTLAADEELAPEARVAAVSKLGYCRPRLKPPVRGQIRRIRRAIRNHDAAEGKNGETGQQNEARKRLQGLVREFLQAASAVSPDVTAAKDRSGPAPADTGAS